MFQTAGVHVYIRVTFVYNLPQVAVVLNNILTVMFMLQLLVDILELCFSILIILKQCQGLIFTGIIYAS